MKDLKYWMNIYNKAEPYSKEHIEASEQIKKLNSGKKPIKQSRKSGGKEYIGSCVEVGRNKSLPWQDATELSNDLGYYATLDDYENPEDSNYGEITLEEFRAGIKNPNYVPRSKESMFIKKYDDSIYMDYDPIKDIHYFYN